MAICNCIIHALQFKKRINEALDVLKEMSEQGCLLNVMNCTCLSGICRRFRWKTFTSF